MKASREVITERERGTERERIRAVLLMMEYISAELEQLKEADALFCQRTAQTMLRHGLRRVEREDGATPSFAQRRCS